MTDRVEDLRLAVIHAGWFAMPPEDGEVWRYRYVGARGQVAAAAAADGYLAVMLMRGRTPDPRGAVVVGPHVPLETVRVVLDVARGEVCASA